MLPTWHKEYFGHFYYALLLAHEQCIPNKKENIHFVLTSQWQETAKDGMAGLQSGNKVLNIDWEQS